VERTTENEKDSRDLVGVVKIDPGSELSSKSGRRNSREPNSSRLAGHLKLGNGKGVDALLEDDL